MIYPTCGHVTDGGLDFIALVLVWEPLKVTDDVRNELSPPDIIEHNHAPPKRRFHGVKRRPYNSWPADRSIAILLHKTTHRHDARPIHFLGEQGFRHLSEV